MNENTDITLATIEAYTAGAMAEAGIDWPATALRVLLLNAEGITLADMLVESLSDLAGLLSEMQPVLLHLHCSQAEVADEIAASLAELGSAPAVH